MREALLDNLKGMNTIQLKNTIDDGISSKQETILVGLGVLFECYYNSLDNHQKEEFIHSLVSLI